MSVVDFPKLLTWFQDLLDKLLKAWTVFFVLNNYQIVINSNREPPKNLPTFYYYSVYFADNVSSVDILKLSDVFCVDIRDTFNKEWRRHSDISTSGPNRDYRQVARYRMRSIEDAAELFALLYKFITEK